jgi:hypothetical protein
MQRDDIACLQHILAAAGKAVFFMAILTLTSISYGTQS